MRINTFLSLSVVRCLSFVVCCLLFAVLSVACCLSSVVLFLPFYTEVVDWLVTKFAYKPSQVKDSWGCKRFSFPYSYAIFYIKLSPERRLQFSKSVQYISTTGGIFLQTILIIRYFEGNTEYCYRLHDWPSNGIGRLKKQAWTFFVNRFPALPTLSLRCCSAEPATFSPQEVLPDCRQLWAGGDVEGQQREVPGLPWWNLQERHRHRPGAGGSRLLQLYFLLVLRRNLFYFLFS